MLYFFKNKMVLVLFFVAIFIPSVFTESRLYGPGLRASFQAPVRYFYLQSQDSKGNKYVVSYLDLTKKKFFLIFRLNHSTQITEHIEFHLTHFSTRLSVHSYRKVDDLNDGTYLFRFRLYESVENLHLYIRFGNEDIEHVIKGHVYSDGCYCPEKNLTEWYNAFECSSSSSLTSQIQEDFKIFDKIDMKKVLNKAKEKYFPLKQTYGICHYVIKNNKVKRKTLMNVFLLFFFIK